MSRVFEARILADAFKRAGLVEHKGKGFNEMFEQQLRAGRDAPSYDRSTMNSVLVSVPLGTADLDLVRFLLTFENEQQGTLWLDQLRVVHEIKAMGSAAPSELAESLAMRPATARNTATQLVEIGVLETRGQAGVGDTTSPRDSTTWRKTGLPTCGLKALTRSNKNE